MLIRPDHIYGLTGQTIAALGPPVYDFAWFDLWAKPLGLMNLLALLAERGNDIYFLDAMHEGREKPLSFGRWKVRRAETAKPPVYQNIARRYYRFGLEPEAMRARLAAWPRPGLVLVTSIMTYWYPGVFETVALARELWPGVPVILGGIYAALCPGHAASSGADHLLIDPDPPRPKQTRLDLYEQPGYGVLATSHGCPRRCGYCASSLLTPRFRPRPLAELTADLDQQMTLESVGDLAFYDDALLWDKENRFYPLADHIRLRHPRLRLHSPNGLSVGDLDERCCAALRSAGLATLRLSLEGIDEYTGAVSSGKTGAGAYERAVANLLAAGYDSQDIETYILLGLPGQKLLDVERTIGFVRSAGASPKLCEFSPIPGTPLFQEALKDDPGLAAEPLRHNNTVYAAHFSGRLDPGELQRLKSLSRGGVAVKKLDTDGGGGVQ